MGNFSMLYMFYKQHHVNYNKGNLCTEGKVVLNPNIENESEFQQVVYILRSKHFEVFTLFQGLIN